MKEKVCKYQDTFYETDRKVFLSRCVSNQCFHRFKPVSHIICDDCPDKVEPDLEDQRLMETLEEDVYSHQELSQRPVEEQRRILDTYCLKCKKLNGEMKTCDFCMCQMHIPIDEFIKFKPFHCPLELW